MEKGSAVLRMLEQYLGAEAFRAGISLYLKKHRVRQHGNDGFVGRDRRILAPARARPHGYLGVSAWVSASS